jgi:hypothetical protein
MNDYQGFCTCHPDRRAPDCGVPAHRKEAAERTRAGADIDEWLDARSTWISDGITRGYLCSEVHCATHDGTPLTRAEEEVFEEGEDDPCVPVVRLANEPGEQFIPRFGP